MVSGGIVYVGDYLDIGKDTFSFAIEDDNDFVVAPVVLEIYETRTVDDQSLVTNLGWTHVALTSHGVASGDLNYVVSDCLKEGDRVNVTLTPVPGVKTRCTP